MRTVAFCECEPYPRAVLAKHWPGVPCYPDVRELTASRLAADGIAVDVICGGFPCQDISVAGKGAGLAGERSGLWREFHRLIRELRPRYVIVENVSALLGRGLDTVLGDLAAVGYDSEWHCIPAAYVGAPHRRDRVWIIAYPGDGGWRELLQPKRERRSSLEADAGRNGAVRPVADSNKLAGHEGRTRDATQKPRGRHADRGGFGAHDLAHANDQRQLQPQGRERDERRRIGNGSEDVENAERDGRHEVEQPVFGGTLGEGPTGASEHPGESAGWRWWATEPDVGRVAHGIPARVDRLKCLGNAVVPQIPEIIGRAIMRACA